MLSRVARAAAALLAAGGIAAARPAPDGGPDGLSWMISVRALRLIEAEPGGRQLAQRFFDNPRTFVMAEPEQLDDVPAHAVATANFASAASLVAALDAGRLDRRYKAVLYDCEAWEFTPEAEQKDPVTAHRLASEAARRRGLLFIAAPATTLRKVLLQPVREGVWPGFLATRLLKQIGPLADVVEIQAQGVLAEPERFAELVRGGAAQARSAGTDPLVLAGLSTGPSGRAVTEDDLLAGVAATASVVQGYWLNIPSKGPHCPACAEARPDIAVRFLKRLAERSAATH